MKLKTKISTLFWTATALYAGSSYMAYRALLDRTYETPEFLKNVFHKPSKSKANHENDEREIWFNEQQFTEFTMENADGEALRAYFLPCREPSNVYVFCAPGFKTTAKRQFRFITKFFYENGINVFMTDHRACGESEGRYISFGVKEYRDALQWIHFMNGRFGQSIKIFLYGVSMGAATVNNMCGDASLPENVKFAVSDCSFTSPWELFGYSLKNAHWPEFPLLKGVDTYNKLLAGFSFKNCVNPLEAVAYSKTPVLFIHGKRDRFVPWEMAQPLFDACAAEDKELWLIENAPHCACYLKEPTAYESRITALIEKYC